MKPFSMLVAVLAFAVATLASYMLGAQARDVNTSTIHLTQDICREAGVAAHYCDG